MKLAFLILTILILSELFYNIIYLNVDESKILIFSFILSNGKIADPVIVHPRYHWSLSDYQVAQELSAWALQSNLGLNPDFATV